jgi:rhodanese-related sulfurtransferase
MNARVELPAAREVCPTTTRRLLTEGALLVDVRERSEIDRLAFDVPGMVAIPLSEFEQRFAELPRDRPLVIACQAGARSLKATYFLMYQGYDQVANMEGGINKWAAKGFPVRGAPGMGASAASSCCSGPATASACCGSEEGEVASPACCSSPKPAAGSCC